MEKKYIYGGSALVLVLVIIIFLLLTGTCSGPKASDKEKLEQVKDPCADALATAQARADSLQLALDICCPEVKVLTVEEQLLLLQKELEALKKAPKVIYRTSKPAPKADVTEMSFGPTSGSSVAQFTPQSNYQKTTTAAQDAYSGQKVSYSSDIPAGSKVGTIVTADRFRLYYIIDNYLRSNGMSIAAPRFNGVDGPEFIYDSASQYWYYLDTRTLLSPAMINNWGYTVVWCVYIGRIGTWDAFLPHESLKAEMKRVRGREDGAITMDELRKMHDSNSDIWTDQNLNGLLMPKSFNPINGESELGTKIGPEDGLIYQGWDFRTRTTGTITTEKINGQ